MSQLVDTSAWIDFFRGEPVAVKRVDPLLRDGEAAVTGPVLAEVVSGATTRAVFLQLSELLGGVTLLSPPSSVWTQAAELRFALARQGIQAHLIDLVIAVTAVAAGATLVTRDHDFRHIQKLLPMLDLALF